MKKIVVTGANGFIGSAFINKIVNADCYVYAVVRNNTSDVSRINCHKNVKIVYCSMQDISLLPSLISDTDDKIFVHTAWEGNSGKDRQQFDLQNGNVVNTVHAYNTCQELNVTKFVSLGTVTEFVAQNISQMPNANAQNLFYGYAKYAARLALEIKSKVSNTQFVWAMLANVFGPTNTTGNIIDYTMTMLKENSKAIFSSGLQPYDFIYIDDCVEALIDITLHKCKDSLYYIGSGQHRKLKEYLWSIGSVLGKENLICIGEREDDGIIYFDEWFDGCNLSNDFGFSSKINFEDAIRKTYMLKYNLKV